MEKKFPFFEKDISEALGKVPPLYGNLSVQVEIPSVKVCDFRSVLIFLVEGIKCYCEAGL